MAKKALISKVEPRESGYRVAQVEDANNIFEVGAGLEWVDCPNDLIQDAKWYDEATKSFKDFPVIEVSILAQPTKEELLAKLQELQTQIAQLGK